MYDWWQLHVTPVQLKVDNGMMHVSSRLQMLATNDLMTRNAVQLNKHSLQMLCNNVSQSARVTELGVWRNW